MFLELTTLTNVPRKEVKFPSFGKEEIKPDIKKEVAKINEHKALPEPKLTTFDDDFDEDGDDLDKIKGDIMKVLSKLDQAEVE